MDKDTNRPNRPKRPQGTFNRPGGQPGNRPNGQNNQRRGNQSQGGGQPLTVQGAMQSRGAAVRAQKRAQQDAQKLANQYMPAPEQQGQLPRRANLITDNFEKLKITFLGGQDDIGEKNMQVVEWQNDAVVLDCGNNLGVELPGINYTIADPTYLESIKHKVRGYVISHGHLDHLGGLKHIVPKVPAPIFGSRFTLGVVEKTFEDAAAETGLQYKPDLRPMHMDNHERVVLGALTVELVRITHSVPESSCIVVETPIGRIINTGDWRLDPEPLDDMPTDAARLRELGDQGVLLLMSDSCGTTKPGRTATEHTLQQSFHDIIGRAEGRVFCAIFSSNMNRIQMIINAAAAAGRRVALDGRSMMSYAEIAVRQGLLKIPKGTVLAMRDIANIPDNQVLVVCTGGQGEPGAALKRMSEGEHKYIKLHEGDTVVISSSPIPGNEKSYGYIADDLIRRGVFLYRHPTHEVDGVGPLHVSGHAARDEYREMLHIVRPKFFLPIYGGPLPRKYYEEMAVEEGWARKNIIQAENGQSFVFTQDSWERVEDVPYGSLLVDQTGAIVNNVVVKDRVLLSEGGLVAVVVTIDKKTGQLLTSPDIVSRGFIYMREQEELMNGLRAELKRAVSQRFKRVDLDRFKAELKDHITHYLFEQTQRSPIVIPVVNVIGGKGEVKTAAGGRTKTGEEVALEQEKRFQAMRARLLGQDARVD